MVIIKKGINMPAKKDCQRLTIDISKNEHIKLKMMSAILNRSMHSIITEAISTQIKGFKGIEDIEKIRMRNGNS